jgi:Peptidase family M23
VRSLLALPLVLFAAGGSVAQPQSVPRLIFPVVGQATYYDDFGEPRGRLRHQGIDILAARKAPAVAAEDGTVEFWTTSASAGCMLYLRGLSGTTYQYIHLNNDLGKGNDNKGRCVPGVAYARGLVNGAAVVAGQQIGFVGDSGDANGIHPHLHFEVHPGGKAAVDPFPFLNRAQKLLFAAKPGSTVTLSLTGTVIWADDLTLTFRAKTLRLVPKGLALKVGRTLTLTLAPDAIAGAHPETVTGTEAVVLTEPAVATLAVQLGKGLTAARVAPATAP